MSKSVDHTDNTSPQEDNAPSQPKKKSGSRLVWLALFVVFNAVVLYFAAKADFADRPSAPLAGFFSSHSLLYLFFAIVCLILVLGAESAKYVLMMRRLGEKVSPVTAFKTAALGKYYDCITPSGAGGQPFQIWYLFSRGYSGGASSAMPLAGFITMQYSFVLLALVVFLFNGHAVDALGIKIAAYVGIFAYALVPTVIVLSAVAPKASAALAAFFVNLGAKVRLVKDPAQTIAKTDTALKSYCVSLRLLVNNRFLLGELFLLSLLFQIALCSIPYFVIHMFGGEWGFFSALSMCVYVYASVTIVPTPGNAGAAEGSFYLLFSQLDTAGLFWAMLVWRFFCYYSFILIGLLLYAISGWKRLIRRRAG